MNKTSGTVLFLGPADSSLLQWLQNVEPAVIHTDDPITPHMLEQNNIDFIVSFGYRHLLTPDLLHQIGNRAINLHISLLPWNRGADPNLWSFVDATPKGVSIHYIDEGIDTGDLIVQKEVRFDHPENETLATTYSMLQTTVDQLFREHWDSIRSGRCARFPQSGKGSIHHSRDKESILKLLTSHWDTPVNALSDKL